jgi:UDP-N-acetylglucosamine 2-epimerase (non-hydrolysing)
MPEEVNRRVTDALADLLFVTSPEAVGYLGNEGIDLSRVHFVGNPMIDTLLGALDRLDPAPFRAEHRLDGAYGVATFHRPVNVDEPAVAKRIVEALREVTQHVPVLLPLHPRGRAVLESVGLLDVDGLRVLEPMGYVQFLSAVRGASFVVTDSGGIQEETTMLRVPCLTLRPNTERPITITHGTNRLVTVDDMPDVVDDVLAGRVSFPEEQPPLWDGKAGPRVAAVLARSV